MTGPTPEKVMQIITGGWATSILGAAAQHGIFTALEGNPATTETVAKKTGISLRGAQALLDGLTGLGFLSLSEGQYQNTPDASMFLVKGKPSYLGGMAEVFLQDFATWQNLPEAAKTGLPSTQNTTDVADNPFWHVLVPAIAALSFPVAQMAAERLGVAKASAASWLDVGGGSGVWSAVWLGVNKQAIGTQLDWPNVNKIARGFVATLESRIASRRLTGISTRRTSAPKNMTSRSTPTLPTRSRQPKTSRISANFARRIKPGGTLVVNDFILKDDRTGHPFAMLFASQMLVATKNGFTYRQSDYRNWLTEAGFKSVEIVPTQTPSTLVFAS